MLGVRLRTCASGSFIQSSFCNNCKVRIHTDYFRPKVQGMSAAHKTGIGELAYEYGQITPPAGLDAAAGFGGFSLPSAMPSSDVDFSKVGHGVVAAAVLPGKGQPFPGPKPELRIPG